MRRGPLLAAPLVRPLDIDAAILLVRGERVMLDSDLAALYGVGTKVLNQAVKRNALRFPPDFAFRLAHAEALRLKSQSVTSNKRGGRHRSQPLVFTEQGVAMLSSVLRSPRAVAVNVEIMRAFVRLRRVAISHADLARRLQRLEARYDARFRVVFEAIRRLMQPKAGSSQRRIGF
jgi:hypothetical protein